MIYCGDLRDLFEAGRRRASPQARYQVFGNGLTLLIAATDESKLVAAIQVVPGLDEIKAAIIDKCADQQRSAMTWALMGSLIALFSDRS